MEEQQSDQAATLYLDLLKKLLTASVYEESAWLVLEKNKHAPGICSRIRDRIIEALSKRSLALVKQQPFSAAARTNGEDWPMIGFTMVGLKRLDNLQACIESVLADAVPGDFMECGVWRGGSSIFARAVFKAYRVTDRRVWLADSFEGMPSISTAADLVDPDNSGRDYLTASLEQVKENFRKFALLDDQVKFLKGWFVDSLPSAPVDRLAILRLDGDHYSSTMDALTNLYDKVSAGGYVIIDDYNAYQGCRNAVTQFRAERQINAEIKSIDRLAVYWQCPR